VSGFGRTVTVRPTADLQTSFNPTDKPIVPHTLLLADDSVTIQRVIELTFADEDVNVIAVSDGDQAIQRIEAAPPDIVLADIGMPGKNGYEVAQHIRRSPRLAHIPVVLLTGAFEPVDQARAAEAGCDGVLAKPFEPQLVIGRVKELLAKSHQKGDASAAAPSPPTETARGGWPPAAPEAVAPAAAPAPAAAQPFELHDYFDRLDAAFANLTPAAPPAPAPVAPAPPPPVPDIDWFGEKAAAPAPPAESWEFATSADAPPASAPAPPPAQAFPAFEPPEEVAPAPSAEEPVPFSFGGDVPPVAPPAPLGVPPPASASIDTQATFPSPPPAQIAFVPPPLTSSGQSAALPPLADAFAALLAAEQDDPVAAHVALWPAGSIAPGADDAMIEEITRRVLDRLSDQVVRETVGEIVSRVAEELVRQEIERIKAQLR
jgi:CheY-like chemotaxis protein